MSSANHAQQPNGTVREKSHGVADVTDAAEWPTDARPAHAERAANDTAKTALPQEKNQAQGQSDPAEDTRTSAGVAGLHGLACL